MKKLFRGTLSLYLFLIILPVLIIATNSDASVFSLQSRAEGTDELRVWFDTNNIIVTTGKPVMIPVLASFNNNNKLVNTIEVTFLTDDGQITVAPAVVHYKIPFQGTAQIGTVTVTTLRPGTIIVKMNAQGHDATGKSIPVRTNPLTVISR